MSILRWIYFYSCGLCFGIFLFSNAWAGNETWPETLTLEFSLKQASLDHPQLQLATAALDEAKAEQLSVDASTDFESRLSAQLRWVDPPEIAYDQSQDDHRLSLFANKRVYDFGYTESLEASARAGVVDREHFLQNALNQHRIAIMAAFFDVMLADLANSRDEENMSVKFIRADRSQDRNELGMVSDIDLLEARSIYQTARVRFIRSGALQRTARSYLANVLNTPQNLPSELSAPNLKSNNQKIPNDIDEWLEIFKKQNPVLLAMQAKVVGAQKRLESARKMMNPVLSGEVEISRYSRESGGNDNWRAGFTLDVPLKTSGKLKAAVAKNRAELVKAKAELEHQGRQGRQAILELWNELKVLKVERDRVEALKDFRDLYLDRNRAIYQMGVKTNLGDAMVHTSSARLDDMRTEFSIALAWARIEALLGKTVYGGEELNIAADQKEKL